MKLNNTDIDNLRTALHASRIIDCTVAVLRDGKILGTNDQRDAAIISDLKLSLSPSHKVGIGRVDELLKRLSLFGEGVEADLRVNDKEEVSQITFSAGRSKAQFRCTAMSMLERKYPTENADPAMVTLSLGKGDSNQLIRAVKTFGAESVIIKIDRTAAVHFECADSNNDRFSLTSVTPAEFTDRDPESVVFMYRANLLADVINAAAKDVEEVTLIMGQEGSITTLVHGHALIVMPLSTGE